MKKILIVDDNQDAAEALESFLQFDGHEVRVAIGPWRGLEAIEQFLPEVVFLDVGMPEMDGCAVARKIRENASLAQPFLIAFTAWDDSAAWSDALRPVLIGTLLRRHHSKH